MYNRKFNSNIVFGHFFFHYFDFRALQWLSIVGNRSLHNFNSTLLILTSEKPLGLQIIRTIRHWKALKMYASFFALHSILNTLFFLVPFYVLFHASDTDSSNSLYYFMQLNNFNEMMWSYNRNQNMLICCWYTINEMHEWFEFFELVNYLLRKQFKKSNYKMYLFIWLALHYCSI